MTASNSKDADQRVPSEALWFASVQFAYEPCVNGLNGLNVELTVDTWENKTHAINIMKIFFAHEVIS